jgi:hypothetical protein
VHHLLEKSWCRLLVGRDVITMRESAPEWVAFDDPHGFYRLMNGGTRGRGDQVGGEPARARPREPVAVNDFIVVVSAMT